jgi:hypothetical protein
MDAARQGSLSTMIPNNENNPLWLPNDVPPVPIPPRRVFGALSQAEQRRE